MGAVAFQKGLGACHSLAHPLSSEHGLHHGLANALCLPAVIDFNESAAAERVLHVGLLLGGEAQLGACAEALRALRSKLGLPSGLAGQWAHAGQLPPAGRQGDRRRLPPGKPAPLHPRRSARAVPKVALTKPL